MNEKIIAKIQKDYFLYTNDKISKKYINKFIIPIFLHIKNSKKNKFLISGSQGIGKTTIIKIIENNFYKFFGKRVLTLSLDDFYYSKNKRKSLSSSVHPLLITRGVPGTHDVKKIISTVLKFKKKQYPIYLPVFSKLKDDILPNTRIIKQVNDILILEGWCCGTDYINKKYLEKNINSLEKKFDKDFVWRNYYNNKLKNEYFSLFKEFEDIIYFKTPSFKNVLKWKIKQEKNLKKKLYKKRVVAFKTEMKEFIKYYEKITKWMMKLMPKKSNLVIFVNKNQKIKKISNA